MPGTDGYFLERPVSVVVVIAILPKLKNAPALALPEKPSIRRLAVPVLERRSRAMVEDIITALSQIPGVFCLFSLNYRRRLERRG